MKECFVITSYCNTYDRVEELKKCINNLKMFNIDILIHAHYPLDLEIQKSVTYYIYDSTNPVIVNGEKIIIRWKWDVDSNRLLIVPNTDYSYAVMSQWKSSLIFLKNKKYDIIHVINYDAFINSFILDKHREFLNDHDAVFEYTNLKPKDYNANEYSDNNLIYIVFFSVKKTFIDIFINELTIEKYMSSIDTMLETYIMEVIDKIESINKNYNYNIGLNAIKIKKLDDSQFKLHLGDNDVTGLKKEDCDVYTTYSESNRFDMIKKTYRDENNIEMDWYYVFGGHNQDNNKFEILIFYITKKINEIIINIADEIIIARDITDRYYSYISNYTMNDIHNIIDNDKLSILIDGYKIEKNIIEYMKNQSIKYKYE